MRLRLGISGPLPSRRRWLVGLAFAVWLVAAGMPATLRADLILNSGTTTISSSTNVGTNLFVARTGTATLDVTGGSVTGTNFYLGWGPGSLGTATVTGGTWASSSNMIVGGTGAGILTLSAGRIENRSVRLGYNFFSGRGTATVTGGTWAVGDSLNVGSNSSLTMSGGLVSVAGSLTKATSGTITLNAGGTLQAHAIDASLLANNGTLIFSPSSLTGHQGTISGTGVIRKEGDGMLVMSSSTTSATTTTISTGTLSMGSRGMLNLSGSLSVGSSGTGTLVMNGGSITGTDSFLGSAAGTVGVATVTSGTWTSTRGLAVGSSGTGTLAVNGGSVTSLFATVGKNLGGVGLATVTGGTWNPGELLTIGELGTGGLAVSGGLVTTVDSVIGSYMSTGSATITGGTWASSGNLSIGSGYLAVGTLTINDGLVSNSSGAVGGASGSVGTVTVTGGTWANTTDLFVGSSGTGTLTMSGGLVSVTGRLSKGAAGTINLNPGGTLQIGVGSTTGLLDVPSLVNNGTLIINRSGLFNYAGVMSGSGSIVQQGGGQCRLAGANSYSGVTTIAGGTLILAGTGSIGTGGLNLGTTASPGTFDLATLTAGTYALPATGNLAGVGTLSGAGKSLAVLGSFLPGNSPGTVTVGTGFTLDLANSGTSLFEITSPLFTAGTFDLVDGAGSVVFGGVLDLAFTNGPYANGSDVLTIFAATGGFSGGFTSVVASGLDAGQYATFNPATGTISVVPEPATYALALIGIACGSLSLRRRRIAG